MYFTARIIIFLLSSALWSSAQPSAPTITCVWFCAEDSPTGTEVPCSPAPAPPTTEVPICVCIGSGIVQCEVCGVGVTQENAQSVCNGGAVPPPPPPTTTCSSLSAGETISPGQNIDEALLAQFRQAAQLASIAYCLDGSGINQNLKCSRFCCNFPDMILLHVNAPIFVL
jgi:hypothetical protein